MTVKLVSDGTLYGTMLVDSETNETIDNLRVTNIDFDIAQYRQGTEDYRVISAEFSQDPTINATIQIRATGVQIIARLPETTPEPETEIVHLDRWDLI